MTWRMVFIGRQELATSLARIRAAGGTLTCCMRCGDGYRVTCAFPFASVPTWLDDSGTATPAA